ARLDLGVGPRLDGLPDLEPVGGHDVAALAVGVVEEGDARGAVRVVLDAGHPRRHAVLVAAEIHETGALAAAAAGPAGRAVTGAVAAGGLLDRLGQALHRPAAGELGEVHGHGVP